MKALILAAGYATRLYPLTKDRPKSLLPIGNKPIIEHIVDNLERIESVNEIIVVSNQRFSHQFQDWLNGVSCVKRIRLINDGTTSEENRLGAVGDMNFVINEYNIADDLLVIGGDNLLTGDLRGFLEFSELKRSSAVGLYDIKNRRIAMKYGVVMLNGDNRLIDFSEKPKVPPSSLIAMCLYYFPKEKLHLISEYLKRNEAKDAIGHYISWLSRVEQVFGYIFDGIWYDIGDKLSYQRARQKFREGINARG